ARSPLVEVPPPTVQSGPGQVIVLNGASSSGKSTVGRELQRILPRPYLFTGIDSFLPMLRPDGHVGMTWTARTNDHAGAPAATRWSDRREHITRQSILTLITTSGSTLPRRNLVLPPRSLPKSLPPKSTRT